MTSTSYVTIPARSTTTTAAPPDDATGSGDAGDAGEAPITSDDPQRERIHEIESGDYLVRIARDYGVPINYLPEYNGWDDGLGHALVPGETIRIPPSDWLPEDERAAASTDADRRLRPSPPQATAAARTPSGAATPRARVAADHDVSIAELDAANAGTRFYSGFVVGIEIIIPC